MYVPLWAIILLGLGSLGFLFMLVGRRGNRDLTRAPSTLAPRAAPAPSFTLPPLPNPEGIPPDIVAELRAMIANGQKIHAIKRVRELTGCGLAEAKDWVDRL
jgi:hypothetical protein